MSRVWPEPVFHPDATWPCIDEIEQAAEEMRGWCVTCEAWTEEGVMPNAERHLCMQCGEHSVYGAEMCVFYM